MHACSRQDGNIKPGAITNVDLCWKEGLQVFWKGDGKSCCYFIISCGCQPTRRKHAHACDEDYLKQWTDPHLVLWCVFVAAEECRLSVCVCVCDLYTTLSTV